jgi:hypothetical protein
MIKNLRRLAVLFAVTMLAAASLTVGFSSSALAGPSGCVTGSTAKRCNPGAGVVTSAGINCPSGNHCVFFSDFNSAHKNFFNGDSNFTDNCFDGPTDCVPVNDNVWSASNSSSANRESHFYYNINPSTSSALVFCLNPGSSVAYTSLSDDGVPGNGVGQRDEISALIIRNRTSVHCF